MYDEVLGETAQRNIDQIDRMIESFGINSQELDRYLIFFIDDKKCLAKINKDETKTMITTNPKSINVIEALITIRFDLNDALKEEIINRENNQVVRSLSKRKDNLQ